MAFPRRVLRATAGMAGYSATFDDNDHHLGRMTVELGSTIDPADATRVLVGGTFGLRDWSNEWDDSYSGNLQFVVLAELERITPPTPGNPRGDLVIVDAEISQVIQHFRSSAHLDSANVFPDNSIRLVADKPTAVRLYVDYDANSGLAPIPSLTGTLDVSGPGGTVTLTPLAPIVPRRDAQIARGQAGHTLIFIIPQERSVGTVTLRARVASAFDPTQFSSRFERTLDFEAIPALPVMAVGINYTGPDINDGATPASLAAPVLADFVNTVMTTEKLFPIPQVSITSFVSMDYDNDIESDINEGCDKFDDLLDAVAEMRGDSEDIVLGLYNTGVRTGSVGGCGGGAAAVARTGRGATVAHELGHALGRQHAPCDNVTRCANPLNTDAAYPRYSGYDSDSIGEFGIDTNDGSVKDPANAHDIMGYSGNKWISPYTYKALLSRIPAVASLSPGAAGRTEQDRGDWIKIKTPHLFLVMSITRQRAVTLRPAFHFPAYPQPLGTMPTSFEVELQDDKGNMLKHACLFTSGHEDACACARDAFPLRIRQAIGFDPAATRLVIYDCGKAIFEQAIGRTAPLELVVDGAADALAPSLNLRWNSAAADALWFLVQWRDAAGTWRGLVPRTMANALTVPKQLFGRQQAVGIRVLASSGIATAEVRWEGQLAQAPIPLGARLAIGLADVASTASGAVALPALLRAQVRTGRGAALPASQVFWYDHRGTEIGRGSTLDLHALSPGFHTISTVVLDAGQGSGSQDWRIEVRRGGQYLLHTGQSSPHDAKE
ncbi:hypothetical protein PO883_22100 [Massilia sp. DJPM01]|uniref:hypothetical protein n=1 Tax=Massilia sp. DJPM01 TaxID=3024404 RepID=UPI00259E3487|nr:hypothetical protein [Massilia sp. DJPM01]MDM5179888.1 hypothetical protein [Massilia sp. DJPM01]